MKLARVLLFNPPHPEGKGFTREGRCTQEAGVWATQWPPVTLATAAAILEKDRHLLKVVDCPAVKWDEKRLETEIKVFQPHFAFWNTATPTLKTDLHLGKMVKGAAPDVVTGVMGTHVSALPDTTALRNPSIDLVIQREPEGTIGEICAGRYIDWKDIPGIAYRDNRSHDFRHNPAREFLKPEDIPAPAWHHLDTRVYRLPLKGAPFLIVAPIRGCPFSCSFCTGPLYYGRKLRKRPVANVVEEIRHNMKRYRVNNFFIWADTFTADRGYVKEFSRQIIENRLSIRWTCNSRVDTIDRETLILMKKAGLWMISFGLESGNDEILKETGKGISVRDSRKAIRLAHSLGLKTSGHFVLGLPGETEKSMKDTLSLALELPLDTAQFYAASPFPGTRLYEQASTSGWLQSGDCSFSQDQAILNLPGLTPEKVDHFRRYAFRKFYGRPKAFWNVVSMARPAALRSILANLRQFSLWTGNRDRI